MVERFADRLPGGGLPEVSDPVAACRRNRLAVCAEGNAVELDTAKVPRVRAPWALGGGRLPSTDFPIRIAGHDGLLIRTPRQGIYRPLVLDGRSDNPGGFD